MKLSSLSFALAVVSAAPSTVSAFSFSSTSRSNVAAFASRNAKFGRPLFGILDEVNSDAYDFSDLLGGGDDDGISPELDAAYETFLAELVFSANDPRVDIVNNIDRCGDEEWLTWLEKKVSTSVDAEEKTALRDLYEMILDIKKQLEVSRMAEERAAKEKAEAEAARVADLDAEAEAGRAMSDTDVLRKASAIDTGKVSSIAKEAAQEKKKSFLESELTPEIRLSYEDMVKKVLPPYKAGDSPASIVFSYYDQFDAQFVKVLTERASNGEVESQAVLDALGVEQQKRIGAATEALKEVLSQGEPMRMEGAIVRMARAGKIDEPFLLLLEANANQAAEAGAMGPATLMRKLKKRAEDEKDKQTTSKEVRLLRKLLRTDDSAEREAILEEAFTPKEVLLVAGTPQNAAKAADGELPDEEKPMPDVPPPDFINACKAVLLNFGNLSTDDDRGDLGTRIKTIASEAEVVATRIYGKGMSVKEQQVSVHVWYRSFY